ncbi:MAG: polyprenyl synthetase family protein [Spirochaetales bacterium]
MTSSEYTRRLQIVEDSLNAVFPRATTLEWGRLVAGQAHLPLRSESLDAINAPGWTLLERGGKRWRPLVMILAHELYGGTLPSIDKLTALVELPHNGSLIIDDIEDKATERRGGPAIHLAHGIDMAINTGNFLYFAPTYFIESSGLSEDRQFRVMKYYLRVMRRLHFGQGLDIQWHNDHDLIPSRDEYLQMCRFKTGALSRLAAEIGAAAAGADDRAIEAVGDLWEDIGVGFQILDDVKNLVTGNPGKLRGDDIIEGKKSLPVLFHAEKATDKGAALMALFERVNLEHAAGRPTQPLIEQAIALMEASGGLDAAYQYGEGLLKAVLGKLDNFPAGEANQSMRFLVNTFWEGLKQ